MSTVSSVSAVSGSSSTTTANQLTGDDFLRLLITELANQDPLEPMDNSQLLQQLTSIQSIQASQSMADGMDQLVKAQQLTQASSLIGKTITGVSTTGATVTGQVERVQISGSSVTLIVGSHTVPLANVTEVLG